MSPGRNDPCPCGSGKKYKKCCLPGEEAARRKRSAEPAGWEASETVVAEPPDPVVEAWRARKREFDSAGYEGKLDLFLRTLDDPELMDGEMALEMLGDLFAETIRRGERSRFDVLLDRLHEQRPEVYESESGSCLDWRVSNALARGPDTDVAVLARDLAALAARDIDRFNIIESRLAYFGQLSVLVEATRLAWPDVESSSDIVPWGIGEFAARAVYYTILDHVARTAEPTADERPLLDRLAPFMEIDPESLARHLAHLTGQAGRRWTLREFESGPTRRFRKDEDWEEDEAAGNADRDFHELTVEFVGHLYRSASVPYTKGDLARRDLCRFFAQRQDGELEHRESMMEAFDRPGRKKRRQGRFPRYDHPLIPDVDRLDQYLARLMDFVFPQPYRAVAFLEIIPAWLGFLMSRGLADVDSADAAISRLSPLAGQLRRLLDVDPDPALRLALDRWPEFHEVDPTPGSRVPSSAEGRSGGPVQYPRQ